jgi:aldehyde:ferredoxin oxidoreductase
MGWQGNVLRINLTDSTINSEPLNAAWAADYLGSRGLGAKYLMEETDPKVDPFSPDNKLIFATGPLTGTMAATGGRYSVVTKSPLTGTLTCSNSGGYFGAELKMAGWDLLILEGRAASPVYLSIVDNKIELRAADHYWGKSVWDVEPDIKKTLQDPETKVASIGRSGEAGVRFAAIVNDLHRAAGRSGVGAVMGSKNLKAIAVRGTKGVTVKDPAAFMQAVGAARAKLDPSARRQGLAKFGTHAMMDNTNAYGSLPTRNARDVQFEGVPKINAKAAVTPRLSDGDKNLVANKACFACTIGCGRMAHMDPSYEKAKEERYKQVSGGLEYENAYAFGPMCGIDDINAITYANFICNEDGIDTISFGATLAAAMELFEIGALTLEDTGGIALNFGNADALTTMVELTATAQGFGKELGQGSKRLCEKYGHPDLAMVSKGSEFPGYDTRAMKGMGLAYATSNRGACHLKASPFVDDFTRITTEGKAKVIKTTQDKVSVVDSSGLCVFPAAVWDLGDIVAKIDAACEGTWTEARLWEVGERIFNLERSYNLAAGLTGKDDTLPKRMLEEPAKSGAAKGQTTGLEITLPEYYQLRGWTEDGVPTNETLNRLKL